MICLCPYNWRFSSVMPKEANLFIHVEGGFIMGLNENVSYTSLSWCNLHLEGQRDKALAGNTVDKRFWSNARKSHFMAFFSFLLVVLLAGLGFMIQSTCTSLQGCNFPPLLRTALHLVEWGFKQTSPIFQIVSRFTFYYMYKMNK